MDAVLTLAREICECGPLAVRYVKEAMYRMEGMTMDEALRFEQDIATHLFATEDSKEGFAAFREKRKPEWKGR